VYVTSPLCSVVWSICCVGLPSTLSPNSLIADTSPDAAFSINASAIALILLPSACNKALFRVSAHNLLFLLELVLPLFTSAAIYLAFAKC